MIKYHVFDSMRDLLPIWAYLKKSYTYVVGLYREGSLIGCHVDSPRNPVGLEQLVKSVFDIFPPRLEDIQDYVEKHATRIEYSYEDSVTGYDEEERPIKNVRIKGKSEELPLTDEEKPIINKRYGNKTITTKVFAEIHAQDVWRTVSAQE